ncbi:hypothetical protein B0H16DRAFT_1727319 [Mycena metata]|uniref:Uncharacterized protein n=1 Tax=Mycena metata TaxID=1033252 RepID=A0AAD7N3R5_9AGAR|nr:hypothetical protein B0H16DRAFT_1727319 [Mycena metata]
MAPTDPPGDTELAAVITKSTCLNLFCLDRLHPDLNRVTQDVVRCCLAAPSDSGVQFLRSVPDAFIPAPMGTYRTPHNAPSPFPRVFASASRCLHPGLHGVL